MAQFDKRPTNWEGNSESSNAADSAIRAFALGLHSLQQDLLSNLQSDIRRLEAEKLRLVDEIERLQVEREHVQQQKEVAQQQALVRQLSQVLANHISDNLQSSLETLVSQAGIKSATNSTAIALTNENANQLLAALDDSLTITLNSLQQDLKNYQSSISQQLSRMYGEQQRGEAILTELVNRLSTELSRSSTANPTAAPRVAQTEDADSNISFFRGSIVEPTRTVTPPSETQQSQQFESSEPDPWDTPEEPVETTRPRWWPSRSLTTPSATSTKEVSNSTTTETKTQKKHTKRLPNLSPLQIGLLAIVISTFASVIYNVALKIIFSGSEQLFGFWKVEQLIPSNLGSSLFVLMLRMLIVVPLMLVSAPILHPRVWQDLQKFIDAVKDKSSANAATRRLLLLSVVSGTFLFLSQVLIYIAIGQIQTGMATTLFFIYPIISILLCWFLFRERPNTFRIVALAGIFLGDLLVLIGTPSSSAGNIILGTVAGTGAGVTFAFYIVFTRICAPKLHPVSFTVVNFATMLLLSFVGLMIPLPKDWSLQQVINSANLTGLFLAALILGALTIAGYLLNNFGIRKAGATRATVIGAAVPSLTVILAGFIIQETLQFVQVLGVLLVTFGAIALNYERMQGS